MRLGIERLTSSESEFVELKSGVEAEVLANRGLLVTLFVAIGLKLVSPVLAGGIVKLTRLTLKLSMNH